MSYINGIHMLACYELSFTYPIDRVAKWNAKFLHVGDNYTH